MTDPRFGRTLGVLTQDTLERLGSSHLVIAGVGGAGGQVAVDLARLGVGHLTLADFDVYEVHNINRQVGAFESTLGKRKTEVVARMCRDINPRIRVKEVSEGVTETNAGRLLEDPEMPPVSFVLEAIDIAGANAKQWLHTQCRQRGITIMTALMVGFGSALHVFPPSAPSYEELFIQDGRINLRRFVPKLGSYLVREYLEACFQGRGHAPTCVVGATAASALMVSEVMRGVLLGKDAMIAWPDYVYVDYFDGTYVRGEARA